MTGSRSTAIRAVPLVLVLAAAASGAAACVGERERLDVPRLTLTLSDTVVAPGDPITGRVKATDHSGIVLLAVYACTRDSIFRRRGDFLREDSIDLPFELPVASNTPPNAPIEVLAVTVDDQNFTVEQNQVIYLRDGTPPSEPPDPGTGLCDRASGQ